MTYILFQDHFDPGMRYEGLARFAFDCRKWGGPNNVAHQSVYNSLFIPKTNMKGLKVLTQIINALIGKYDSHIKQELIELRDSLEIDMEQKTAIELIDYIIKIINDK